MNNRIKKLQAQFPSRSIDAFLVSKEANIRYLTEFPASESWLLVTRSKTFYITDARYSLEAKEGLRGIEVKKYQSSMAETIFDLVKIWGVKSLAVEDHHLTVAQFKSLKKHCPKTVKLIGTSLIIDKIREVKEEKEIRQIEKALSIHKDALDYLKTIVKPKITEFEILLKLENFVRSKGAGFSFSPIIASGPNSCYPHAKVTHRRLRNHEPVLIDTGMDLNGYKSDLTRIFYLGTIRPLVAHVREKVWEAQQLAIKNIKPGAAVKTIDALARNLLTKYKLDQYFTHALGHGVGLEIHESPRLSQKDPSILQEGMVVTVEPAVYIPRQFGIRLEEMVLVTKKGNRVLSGRIH